MKDKNPATAEQIAPEGYPYCNDRWSLHLCDRPEAHDADGDQHECRCGWRW